MASYYTWSADVAIASQGRHDARGMHRAAGPVSEADLKSAVARDIATKHQCDLSDIHFSAFAYTEVA